MMVAQFEDSEGYCIGLHHNGRWINYTDAEAAYTSVTQKVVVEPTTTILQIVEDGRFDPSEFKRVLNFLKKHTLEVQYLPARTPFSRLPNTSVCRRLFLVSEISHKPTPIQNTLRYSSCIRQSELSKGS